MVEKFVLEGEMCIGVLLYGGLYFLVTVLKVLSLVIYKMLSFILFPLIVL